MVSGRRLALGLGLGLICGVGGLLSIPAGAQGTVECGATSPVMSPVLARPGEFDCGEPHTSPPVIQQPVIEEPLDICDFYGFCNEPVAAVP